MNLYNNLIISLLFTIIAISTAIITPNAFRAIEKAKIVEAAENFKAFKNATYPHSLPTLKNFSLRRIKVWYN